MSLYILYLYTYNYMHNYKYFVVLEQDCFQAFLHYMYD